jgi:hypothetical protein
MNTESSISNHIKHGHIHSTQIFNLYMIKSGPKPIADSTGKVDKRRRVTPENKPKHKPLKIHNHKDGD